jgi:hypothetical protein
MNHGIYTVSGTLSVDVFSVLSAEHLLADRHWCRFTGTTLPLAGVTVGDVGCLQASFLELADFYHVFGYTPRK